MMRPFLFFLLFVGLIHPISGQKKQLEHSDFAHWKSLGNSVISADGKWVSYTLIPGEGVIAPNGIYTFIPVTTITTTIFYG
jgi:hypothetical protein